jgi:hypothetical protein
VATPPVEIRNLQHTTVEELGLSPDEFAALLDDVDRAAIESRRDHCLPDPE